MRAVNLIPSDQRSGQSVGAGRSEGAAYALLGLLAAVAVLAVLYGKAHRDISSREHETTRLSAEASRAQSEASALTSYTSFVALQKSREQAVETLVDSRFDWAHAFHELGRVLTAQTSISSLTGSIAAGAGSTAASPAASTPSTAPGSSTASTGTAGASPSAAAATGTAASSSVSSATPPGSVPVFTLAGCATSQRAVAEMLVRLRLIDGVSSVSLQSSTKATGGGGGASSSGACPANDPAFTVGLTFDPLPTASAAQAATKAGAKTVADTEGAAK